MTANELVEVGYSLVKERKPYEVAIGDFLLDWCNEEDVITVNTSGSTGKPQPITLKKGHMVNSALATGSCFNLSAGDSALLCLPAEFIAGKMMLVRAMVLGLELDYVAPSSTPLKKLRKKYHFVAMVPIQVEHSMQQLNQIKTLIIGGAKLSRALAQSLLTKNHNAFETYGMTETITHIALKPVNGTHFITLPKVKVTLDKRSCLVINAPEIGVQDMVTNDVAALISETEFEWLGRYDNIINSGGIKILPEQLEAKLSGVLPMRFFITGISDTVLGQKVALIYEGDEKPTAIEDSMTSVKSLSKYERPKKILGIPKFPETRTGKIRRKETLALLNVE